MNLIILTNLQVEQFEINIEASIAFEDYSFLPHF